MMIATSQSPMVNNCKQEAERILEQQKWMVPPVDPSIIAKKLNIKVLDCSFEDANISGYYDFEENTIYINRNEFIKRQQFTIAHELGHALLHKEWVKSSNYTCLYRNQLAVPSADNKETEANEFAANLLVPRFMLDQYYKELIESQAYLIEDCLQKISDAFFVSLQVVKIRLKKEYGYP